MNIKSVHTDNKSVSGKKIFSAAEGTVNAIQIKAGACLPDHISKIPTLLICISGKAVFIDEIGHLETLTEGDIISIAPEVQHRIEATEETHLILIK